jgi:hypothetical protein
MRVYHLEYEEVVLLHQPCVDKLAFKVGVALADQRRPHPARGIGRYSECFELLIALPDELPMPTTASIKFLVGTLITHSLLRRLTHVRDKPSHDFTHAMPSAATCNRTFTEQGQEPSASRPRWSIERVKR